MAVEKNRAHHGLTEPRSRLDVGAGRKLIDQGDGTWHRGQRFITSETRTISSRTSSYTLARPKGRPRHQGPPACSSCRKWHFDSRNR